MKSITKALLIAITVLSLLSSCAVDPSHSLNSEPTSSFSNTSQTTNEVSSDHFDDESTTDTEPQQSDLITTAFPSQIPESSVSKAMGSVLAESAFVFNVTKDELIAIKGEDNRICPASITKLFSILYALSVAPIGLEISPRAEELDMVGQGSSIAYIKTHHRLTVAQLIKGMLLPSGNDAAYSLAAGVSRYVYSSPDMCGSKAVRLFMEGVNKYAADLGCTDTVFTVPDGLAGCEHSTSLHDLILIGKEALKSSIITEYASIVSERVYYASGHSITWNNTNRLINPQDSYYSPYVTGLKTGSLTDNYCLYVSANINGETYLIGIFASPTTNSRYDDAHILIDSILSLT